MHRMTALLLAMREKSTVAQSRPVARKGAMLSELM